MKKPASLLRAQNPGGSLMKVPLWGCHGLSCPTETGDDRVVYTEAVRHTTDGTLNG